MNISSEMISLLLAVLIPIVGIIAKRLGTRIPEAWAAFLTEMDPEDTDKAVTLVSTSKGRETWVKSELRMAAARVGLILSDQDAEVVMKYAKIAYSAGITFAKKAK